MMLTADELQCLREQPPDVLCQLLGELSQTNPDAAADLVGQLQAAGTITVVDKVTAAGHFGISVKTLESWQQRGLPYRSRGEGRPVAFDLAACAKWLAAQKGTAGRTSEEAKLAEELKRAKLAGQKLENERKAGRLVNASIMEQVMRLIANEMRRGVDEMHRQFGNDWLDLHNDMVAAIETRVDEEFARLQTAACEDVEGDDMSTPVTGVEALA